MAGSLFDWDWKDGSHRLPIHRPGYLSWLENHVGIDYFSNVACVNFQGSPSRQEDEPHFAPLLSIENLEFDPSGNDSQNGLLTDGGLASFEGHTRLRELDLSYTNTSDSGLVHLRSLTRLRNLNLCHTLVSDEGLAYLVRLANLQELDLSYTNVTDAGLIHLKALTELKRLDLESTKISRQGVRQLKGLVHLQVLEPLRHESR